mmetsp:Transcript_23704/g.40819  ORF Transcript_23704/g.40819 Transcript_23704/m.40819 type:complete len:248 (-) Transcript_23704:483-1226(-)
MSHLRLEMLPESNELRSGAPPDEEQERPAHEVREGLVRDNALSDGVSEFHRGKLAGLDLGLAWEELDLEVGDLAELGVALVVRVHEVLDLREGELPDTDEARSWGNLVPEGEADLGASEGHAVPVEVKQPLEVYEDALGRLGPHVSWQIASWADGGLEHEVEREGFGEVVAGVRRLDLELLQLRGQLLLTESIGLRPDSDEVFAFVSWQHRVFHQLVNALFQQLVSAVAVARDDILHHHVVELVDMP